MKIPIFQPVSSIGYDSLDFTFWGPRFDGDFIHTDRLTAALVIAPNIKTLVTIDSNADITFGELDAASSFKSF